MVDRSLKLRKKLEEVAALFSGALQAMERDVPNDVTYSTVFHLSKSSDLSLLALYV